MMSGALRDIQGLDAISWWPPAAGWWLSLAALILAIIATSLLIRHLLRYPPGSWRSEARKGLSRLRRRYLRQSQKQSVSELSELLRRIAIARFGRERLASLTGREWLQWLTDSDPNGFDWVQAEETLLRLPYAPEQDAVGEREILRLIDAALSMVGNSRGTPSSSLQEDRDV